MGNSRKLASIDTFTDSLEATVGACVARYVSHDQRVAIGLSGGIDSVCLLHLLTRLRNKTSPVFTLSAVHVNHGISQHANRWDVFCRDLCDSLSVCCVPVRVAVEKNSKDGLESAARRARHEVFDSLDANWVMLAHHQDDQAETLLFNLVRGTGITGAGAMRERNGKLLRPLLSVSRADLVRYAQCLALDWIEDDSNADTRHSRNFLRQNIFPELKGRFPAASKNLAAAASRFAEANDLLDDLARQDLGVDCLNFPVSIEKLKALSEGRARNVLRFMLSQQCVRIPSEVRLREVLRQMCEAGDDRHPSMEFDRHRLFRRRGWIYLEPVSVLPDIR